MKTSSLIALIAAVLGLAITGFVFLNQSSPYVTIAQAKQSKTSNVHVPGQITAGTIFNDVSRGEVRFTLNDEKGESLPVTYKGPAPANLGMARQVVAIGTMKGENFSAEKLLLKCPSKYESGSK